LDDNIIIMSSDCKMPPLIENNDVNGHGANYYTAGNQELAIETKLTLSRLEPVSFSLAIWRIGDVCEKLDFFLTNRRFSFIGISMVSFFTTSIATFDRGTD
jgi:hypothetical protein